MRVKIHSVSYQRTTDPEWYTVREAARLVGVGESAMRKRSVTTHEIDGVQYVAAGPIEEERAALLDRLRAQDAREGPLVSAADAEALRVEIERRDAKIANLLAAIEALTAAARD